MDALGGLNEAETGQRDVCALSGGLAVRAAARFADSDNIPRVFLAMPLARAVYASTGGYGTVFYGPAALLTVVLVIAFFAMGRSGRKTG